ncbi:hypothetical protein ACRAS4_32430 [Streptomyces lividans]
MPRTNPPSRHRTAAALAGVTAFVTLLAGAVTADAATTGTITPTALRTST